MKRDWRICERWRGTQRRSNISRHKLLTRASGCLSPRRRQSTGDVWTIICSCVASTQAVVHFGRVRASAMLGIGRGCQSSVLRVAHFVHPEVCAASVSPCFFSFFFWSSSLSSSLSLPSKCPIFFSSLLPLRCSPPSRPSFRVLDRALAWSCDNACIPFTIDISVFFLSAPIQQNWWASMIYMQEIRAERPYQNYHFSLLCKYSKTTV